MSFYASSPRNYYVSVHLCVRCQMHVGGCVRRYGGGILCCRDVICIPIKDDTVAEKLSQELKGK